MTTAIPEFKKKETSLVFTDKMREKLKGRDIILEKVGYTTYINEKGEEVKRRTTSKVNITKKVNESKKLLKTTNAIEKLEELDNVYGVK